MRSEQNHTVRITVPATSANLGPGFDAFGLALEMRDELEFSIPDGNRVEIDICGEGSDSLPRDESHLVVRAFRKAQEEICGETTGVVLKANNRIPQARGLGSSAEAIVSGVAAALALAGKNIEESSVKDTLFDIAARIEGHPDNVAPAVYGQMTASWSAPANPTPLPGQAESAANAILRDGKPGNHTIVYPVADIINAYVFIPDYSLSTEEARKALPEAVSRADALLNVSRAALLPGVMSGIVKDAKEANDILMSATVDVLHQDYRRPLMMPSAELVDDMRDASFAAAISGAGPCVLVLHAGSGQDCGDQDCGETEIKRIAQTHLDSGHWRMERLQIAKDGVRAQLS